MTEPEQEKKGNGNKSVASTKQFKWVNRKVLDMKVCVWECGDKKGQEYVVSQNNDVCHDLNVVNVQKQVEMTFTHLVTGTFQVEADLPTWECKRWHAQ